MSSPAVSARRSAAQSFEYFKSLEAQGRSRLPHDAIHIVRLDGRAFSTYTRGLQVPFDATFCAAMDAAAIAAAKEVGALATFVASDEVSVAFAARGQRSELPFGGQVTKLLSLLA